MTEKSGHSEAEKKSSGGQALVQIGHYVLGETLGIGTFGKVKGNRLKQKLSIIECCEKRLSIWVQTAYKTFCEVTKLQNSRICNTQESDEI